MKAITKSRLKKIAIAALESEYGFAPKAQNKVEILAFCNDGTYILFEVNEKRYEFNSYTAHFGYEECVWVGSGTITKIA